MATTKSSVVLVEARHAERQLPHYRIEHDHHHGGEYDRARGEDQDPLGLLQVSDRASQLASPIVAPLVHRTFESVTSRHAAVDDKVGARREAGFVGEQVDDGVGHLRDGARCDRAGHGRRPR